MLLTAFCFAFWAFILASNIFDKFRSWLIAGIVTLVLTYVSMKFELMVLFLILLLGLTLITIYLVITQHFHKH